MTKKLRESDILPDYPRTLHLPHKPNVQRGDLISSVKECGIIFDSAGAVVEEKIDGANCGMAMVDNQPIIRNRNHILHKGFSQARTPAKMQFASVWNWWYENKEKFDRLAIEPVSVYGEWLYATHGLPYTHLPSLFVAFDLYNYERQMFVDPIVARSWLTDSGFQVVPLLHTGKIESYEQLEYLCQQDSLYAPNQKREGVYVKVGDGEWMTHRWKMVRHDFIQGGHWSKTSIKKNKVLREGS
jgi:atypical dual specificity phosphatase